MILDIATKDLTNPTKDNLLLDLAWRFLTGVTYMHMPNDELKGEVEEILSQVSHTYNLVSPMKLKEVSITYSRIPYSRPKLSCIIGMSPRYIEDVKRLHEWIWEGENKCKFDHILEGLDINFCFDGVEDGIRELKK